MNNKIGSFSYKGGHGILVLKHLEEELIWSMGINSFWLIDNTMLLKTVISEKN